MVVCNTTGAILTGTNFDPERPSQFLVEDLSRSSKTKEGEVYVRKARMTLTSMDSQPSNYAITKLAAKVVGNRALYD